MPDATVPSTNAPTATGQRRPGLARNGRGQVLLNLDQWRAASSQAFGTLHITSPAPDEFRAAVGTVSAGGINLYDMTTPPHRVERRAEDISPSAPTSCKLSLQLDGACVLAQDGRSVTLRPGHLALYVTSRPYVLSYASRQHSLVVKFPRSFVQLADEDLARLTATAVTDSEGLGRVAVPLFEQLAVNLHQLDSPHATALVRSALDMLVAVFSQTLATSTQASSSGEGELVRQIKRYVREHLDDEDLGPRSIAQALFISVRHLHSQFASTGMSVSSYIRIQRLERIHRDLCAPELAGRSIQEIGSRWGLPDASHLSRVFKARYGVSPSTLRRRVLQEGSAGPHSRTQARAAR